MKKLFFTLITLFIVYLLIQVIFNLFNKGSKNDYVIVSDNIDFIINEKSYFSNNLNNYSYSIKAKNNTFKFQINYDFVKNSQIITDIKYFNDNKYECILPIFKNNLVIMDMICYNDGNMNYYYNLRGKNKNLDDFMNSLNEYDVKKYVDDAKAEKIEGINVYKNNLIDNHYIGINNNKGIYNISKNFNSIVYNISLYDNDIPNPKISTYVDEYFISADYTKDSEFNKFDIISLPKLETYTFTFDKVISLDSYIQGVVDGKVYLYDKVNKIQYEIDIAASSITSYNSNDIKYYKEGKWTFMTIEQADKELKFSYNHVDLEEGYSRVDKEWGFYYLYKKNGNEYDVYRRSVSEKETLIYLFSTKTIDNIRYIDNYIYFINGNELQVYSDLFGVKRLVQYDELEFSKNFAVYLK